MKKGFTLIEVILAIGLISILAINFIPFITFAYINLMNFEKLTKDIFESQKSIEFKIEDSRHKEPTGNDQMRLFGMDIKGHIIKEPIGKNQFLVAFQPKLDESMVYKESVLEKANPSNPTIVILDAYNTSVKINPIPKSVNMIKNGSVNFDCNFLADENNFKIANKNIHLVNVYKWYLSPIVNYVDNYKTDKYSIIKEWNAARGEVTYKDSKGLNFIPNIQNNPSYNTFKFSEIINGLEFSVEELINRFGNRYIYYSVTPYAISGKIGKEEISNGIYINAPRLEIEKSIFGPDANQISIVFKDSIGQIIDEDDMENIHLNQSFGQKFTKKNGSDSNILILEFEQSLNRNTNIEGNTLSRGAVESSKFGAIDIWYNGEPNGEFEIINEN